MRQARARIQNGGRIVIPAGYRKALGVDTGDEVILRLEDGELRLFTPRRAVQRAQELVRRHIPEGRSLSDELIADRRSESEHE